MTKRFLILACISGMLAVILGAFGAHILKRVLTDVQVQVFDTGVRYQFYHTFAIIAAALIGRYTSRRWSAAAAWLFVAGIALFSGSLYLISLSEFLEFAHLQSVIGPITPLGGLLFIMGWTCLLRASIEYERKKSG